MLSTIKTRERLWAPLGRGLRLFGKYVSFNLRSGMEYRVSFLVQVFGMALNNTAFIFFWMILFSRIGGDIAGYGFTQVMYLWSMIAAGFGLSAVFLGNTFHLSRIIYSGELDVYLLQPKPVLGNVAASRMIVSGWGDLGYGVILFLFTQPLTPVSIAFFVLFSVLTALVFCSVLVIYHSLTFWLGNAEGIAGLAHEAMISLTLYPGTIFEGPIRIVMHSLIPAAFVAWLPVELIQAPSWAKAGVILGADAAFVIAALLVFAAGLRRYESGNRMGTRV